MTENLSNSLKKKLDENGKKDTFIQLDNCWKWKWGCGLHYNVETIWFPDFGDMCWFHRRMCPFWIKHMEYFRCCGKCEYFFTIIKSFLNILNYWKVNYFSKQPCKYHKRKSDQTGLKLFYRGQDLPRSSSRELWCSLSL